MSGNVLYRGFVTEIKTCYHLCIKNMQEKYQRKCLGPSGKSNSRPRLTKGIITPGYKITYETP